jgi:hypothetical protein
MKTPAINRMLSRLIPLGIAFLACLPSTANASHFKGETLDKAADVLTWIVLIVAPVIGIGAFLMVHILPEKVAEKRRHPQAKAIQCLCILSLIFGGMLWPLAWLWAYSKPVMYKLAYGTDVADEGEHGSHKKAGAEADQGEHGSEAKNGDASTATTGKG